MHGENLLADYLVSLIAEHPTELVIGLEQDAIVVDDDSLNGRCGEITELLFAFAEGLLRSLLRTEVAQRGCVQVK